MTTDQQLLAHYVARGAEAWNVSLEAAWLDYTLRAWVRPRLPTRPGARVANVGIGVGLWDDWLGYELGALGAAPLVSVDRDPAICATFAARQRREGHPFPARVVCGDVADGALGVRRFDAITIVGSTLAETGAAARAALDRAVRAALIPGGVALVAEVGNRAPPIDAEIVRLGEIWVALRAITAP